MDPYDTIVIVAPDLAEICSCLGEEVLFIRQNDNKVKLSEGDIERIIRVAENATRRYINSKLPRHEIEDLDISVEVETNEDLKVDIEVDLDTFSDNEKYQEIVERGVEAAHTAIKDELDKIEKR
nr:DUF3194 domain-containing protein [Candidatus Njordarchaeum guaymaensis]